MNARDIIEELTLSDVPDLNVDSIRMIRDVASQYEVEPLETHPDRIVFDVGSIIDADFLMKDYQRLSYEVERNDAVLTVYLK